MKTRTGFISNSSSCSFTICKCCISERQINHIRNHIEYAIENNMEDVLPGLFEDETPEDWYKEEWVITEEECHLKGSTMMDNFDMKTFLAAIGVPEGAVQWKYYYY